MSTLPAPLATTTTTDPTPITERSATSVAPKFTNEEYRENEELEEEEDLLNYGEFL